MQNDGVRSRACVCVALLALLLSPGGAFAAWMQVAAVGTTPAAPDGEWPRRVQTPSGEQIVVYEPQVASWDNQKLLTLQAVMAYTAAGSDKPILGTITAEADTRVSVEERLVDFSSFRVIRSNFPNASREQAAAAVAALKAGMPPRERVIALDRVLAAFDASSIRPKNVEGVKADPPVVFFSMRPAILVNLDGDPIWSPIKGNELRFAVNTNWDLFEYPPTKEYFLRHEKIWLKAASVNGPWGPAGTLPPSFAKLPADKNWDDVRAAMPARAASASSLPAVFVSTKPAELILLRGEPQYKPVAGTNLLWVSNTESDVFRLGQSGPVYFLVSGRWFSSPGFKGPWTFATPNLPPEFAKIPLEHERSRVLASVPGTVQAAEAVLLAEVPQTARVNKKTVMAPEVAYQGAPEFVPIEKTTVSRAANTDKDILKVGDLYYMCFQGVWFSSKTASGPWEVTGSVPEQIYEIPISSPSHHVTYVTVEDDDDDDEWVTFAAAAAYTGMMVAWGTAVWGSGWYYPPYVRYGGFYPAYLPYYPTYGYGARYNPWTGTYGRGAAVYGPYGGAGVGARYNPRTGTYSRGAAAYGPYGSRAAGSAYNPRTGTYAATRQGSNPYSSWGSTGVRRGDDWAATSRVTNRATGTTTRATRTSEGGAAVTRRGPQGGGFAGSSASGDMYAGRDGNVYRKDGGSWQKYENGGWNNVPQASPRERGTAGTGTRERATAGSGQLGQASAARMDASTFQQLSRDSTNRNVGSQRTRDASVARSSSGSSRSTSSYRPSGGGGSRSSSGVRSSGGGGMRGGGGGGMRGGGGRGGGGRGGGRR